MKKKILVFALSVCLIIPCMIMFSGCDKKDDSIHVGENMTLSEAVGSAKSGDTIVIDKDITLDTQINIDKEIVIDMNGKTINNTTDIWNDPDTTVSNDQDTWSLISVKTNGNLTIKNGTMKAKENDCYAIDVRGGNLTIESGTYIGNISSIYVVEGDVLVNGGEFSVQQQDPNFSKGKFTLNAKDANAGSSANITVKGGKYANFNPTEFLADGYKFDASTADANGDVWYTVSQN